MESPLARRAVSDFSCSTVAEGALRTWVSVREGKIGPAELVDDFKRGALVCGNNMSDGEGLFAVGLLGKGDEVANLVGYPLTEKWVEWPPLLRGNAE